MLIHKYTYAKKNGRPIVREGWYLFGLIPIYVREV